MTNRERLSPAHEEG
ncbi:Protein of unknown function [Thermobacillus xylanilyticus]|uniref:Uncharacterized protein n=1 Tax=Thermobacillus xylanilyticus TaxID=76633 RepID=A0ABN7S7R2_THEXY|nr:Protein of unknown function [Thermobacillus xylanilyticus]